MRKAKRRNCSKLDFNVAEFSQATRLMSLEQVGALVRGICERVSARDKSIENEKPVFIGRIYWQRGKRPYISVVVRRKVYAKAGFRCVACGADGPLTLDHRKAFSKGGSDDIRNLQAMCRKCNQKKGAR